jgi:hypothetical protein
LHFSRDWTDLRGGCTGDDSLPDKPDPPGPIGVDSIFRSRWNKSFPDLCASYDCGNAEIIPAPIPLAAKFLFRADVMASLPTNGAKRMIWLTKG